MDIDTNYLAYLARRAVGLSEDEALLRLRRDLQTISARLQAESPKVHSRSLIAASALVEGELSCRPHLTESPKAIEDADLTGLIARVLGGLPVPEREAALTKVLMRQSLELQEARTSLRAAMRREEKAEESAADLIADRNHLRASLAELRARFEEIQTTVEVTR